VYPSLSGLKYCQIRDVLVLFFDAFFLVVFIGWHLICQN